MNATVTGDQIAAAKGELGSWRAVAERFNLGSPNHARKLYTTLTGKPHAELNATGTRAAKAPATSPDGSPAPATARARRSRKPAKVILEPGAMTTTTIAEAITGRTLVVNRGADCVEEIPVARVRGFHVIEKACQAASLILDVGDLCVEFVEGRYSNKGEQLGSGAIRTVAIKMIKEVTK